MQYSLHNHNKILLNSRTQHSPIDTTSIQRNICMYDYIPSTRHTYKQKTKSDRQAHTYTNTLQEIPIHN